MAMGSLQVQTHTIVNMEIVPITVIEAESEDSLPKHNGDVPARTLSVLDMVLRAENILCYHNFWFFEVRA